MTYAKIILALLSIVGTLAKFFERRGYLNQGARNAILAGLQKEMDNVEIALKARADAHSAIERNPGGLRDDDGFKRPD